MSSEYGGEIPSMESLLMLEELEGPFLMNLNRVPHGEEFCSVQKVLQLFVFASLIIFRNVDLALLQDIWYSSFRGGRDEIDRRHSLLYSLFWAVSSGDHQGVGGGRGLEGALSFLSVAVQTVPIMS